jgi:hypothetical protein
LGSEGVLVIYSIGLSCRMSCKGRSNAENINHKLHNKENTGCNRQIMPQSFATSKHSATKVKVKHSTDLL